MSKVAQREQKLLELLQTYRRFDIKKVSEWLDISETTARRMCARFEDSQKVIRVHGGVQLPEKYLNDYSYHNKELKHLHEKVAIGNYCASLIESGERIFCDSGTTVHQIVLADADTSYIMADSSKFDKSSFVSYANSANAHEKNL